MIRRAVLIAAAALAAAVPAAGAAAALPPTEATDIRPAGDHGVTVTVRTPGDLTTAGVAARLGDVPALVEEIRPTGPRRRLDLVFAVDTSGSMAGQPLAAAIEAGQRLLAAVGRGDRVALVSFDDAVRVVSPLTEDTGAVSAAIADLGTHNGTALYDGVAEGIAVAGSDADARRIVIVLSDGADTASTETTLGRLRTLAAASGVEVNAVGLTSSADYVAPPLRQITAAGGGQFVSTDTVSGLKPLTVSLAQSRLSSTYEVRVSLPESSARELKLSVGGAPEATLDLPAGASGLAPSALRRYGGPAVAILAAMAILVGLSSRKRRPATLTSRLEPYTAAPVRTRAARPAFELEGVYAAMEARLGERLFWRRLARLGEQAGITAPTAQVTLFLGAAGLLLGVVGFAAGGPFAGLAGLFAGVLVPIVVLRIKASRREKRFEEQLPELLGVLASALRAGRSFPQALDSLLEEAEEPALSEFRRAQHQVRLGVPVEQALDEMSQRLRSDSFELVVLTTDVQRRIGGNVAEVFDQVANTIRVRQQFTARVRALTAMGKMSAYVLVGLPFVLAGMLTGLNRDYMMPLYSTGTGHTLIALGFVMMALGSIVLRRMVRPRAIA